MAKDTIFEVGTSRIRYGPGATGEVGMDLADLGVKRVMVVTDSTLAKLPPVARLLESIKRERVDCVVFDRVRIEPTDESFLEAIAFAQAHPVDAFVAIGGGSSIDTAKAINLYATYPADLFDYVNVPMGKGLPVPGPLKPLLAIPTTAGTGSETTGVCVFDVVKKHAKTGISHARLKPLLGIVDPDNTCSLPPMVAASAGLDVLSHAIESYTAIPYDQLPRPARPSERPPYQGSNPISDLWALEALRLVAEFLPRAVSGKAWRGRYRGQKQKWFAMRFLGQDSDVDLETHHPEFEDWRWIEPERLPELVIPFKRGVYEAVLEEFRPIIEGLRA